MVTEGGNKIYNKERIKKGNQKNFDKKRKWNADIASRATVRRKGNGD